MYIYRKEFYWGCAINLKQVKVVFSKALDKTSAEKAANYTVSTTDNEASTAVTNASLQADGKTVILTLTGYYSNQKTNQSITISGVKDSDKNVLTTTYNKFDISYVDNTIPTVTSVEAIGPHTVQLNFSEPVVKGTVGAFATAFDVTDFTVDDGAIGVTDATANPVKSSITVNLSADLSAGAHSIKVNASASNQFADYAGLPVMKSTQNFNFAEVTGAPTVLVSKASPDKVTLKFSRPVKNVDTATIYHDFSNLTSGTPVINTNGNQDGTYSDMWDVPFANYVTGASVLYIEMGDDAIVDRYGNEMEDTNVAFTASVDNTAPTVLSVTAKSTTEIQVKFSEDVVVNDAKNAAYYVLKDNSGKVLTGSDYADLDSYGHPYGASFDYDANTTTTTITFNNPLKAGSFQLATKDIRDKATYTENKLADNSKTFSVTDVSKLALSFAAKAGNKIVLTFSKPVATSGNGSALDPKNYQVIWNGGNAVALPDGSSIGLGASGYVVEITLGSTANYVSGTTQIAAAVTDSTGKAIDSFNATALVSDDAGVAAISEISNVKLLSKKKISFEVAQPLKSVTAAKIKVNGNAVNSVSFVNQTLADGTTYGAVVTANITTVANYLDTLVVNDTTDKLAQGGVAVDLTFDAGAFTNLQGTASTLADNYDRDVKDYAGSYIASIVTKDSQPNGKIDAITVTFSEPVLLGSVTKDSFTVTGYTVTNVIPTNVVGGSSDVYDIVVTEQSAPDTSKTPNVKLVKSVTDASAQENVQAIDTSATAATDAADIFVVNGLVGAGSGKVIAASTSVTISFSEALNAAAKTAVTGALDGDKAGAGVATYSWSTDSKTLTISVSAAGTVTYAGTDDITVSLTDAASNTATVTLATK